MARQHPAYVFIGATLLLLYLLQQWLGLEWTWLADLQQQESYKRWSGFALTLVIAAQWSLTAVRGIKKWLAYSLNVYTIHLWIGTFLPVVLYAHAMAFGYAYLFMLSVVFVVNMAIGFINPEFVKKQTGIYQQGWMITHVSLSLFSTLLVFYHIWIVFYYN